MTAFEDNALAHILNDVAFRTQNGRLDPLLNEYLINWDHRLSRAIANHYSPFLRFGDLAKLFDGINDLKVRACVLVYFDPNIPLPHLSGHNLEFIKVGFYQLPDGSERRFGFGVMSSFEFQSPRNYLIGHDATEALLLYYESTKVWRNCDGVTTFGDTNSDINLAAFERMLSFWCDECDIPPFDISDLDEHRLHLNRCDHDDATSDYAADSRYEYEEVSDDEPNDPYDGYPDDGIAL
jgi:hypothetical protein